MILRIAGVLFIFSRIFCHLTGVNDFTNRVYYSLEVTWQLCLVLGVYVNGLNKSNRQFLLILMPFFVFEFIYTMLHSFGVIILESKIEAKAIVMVESIFSSVIVIYYQYNRVYGSN